MEDIPFRKTLLVIIISPVSGEIQDIIIADIKIIHGVCNEDSSYCFTCSKHYLRVHPLLM